MPGANLITGGREITENQVMIRKVGVDERFQPAVMLHPIRQRIADQADMVALAQAESFGASRDTEQSQPGANTKKSSHEHPDIVQVFLGASSRQCSCCSRFL